MNEENIQNNNVNKKLYATFIGMGMDPIDAYEKASNFQYEPESKDPTFWEGVKESWTRYDDIHDTMANNLGRNDTNAFDRALTEFDAWGTAAIAGTFSGISGTVMAGLETLDDFTGEKFSDTFIDPILENKTVQDAAIWASDVNKKSGGMLGVAGEVGQFLPIPYANQAGKAILNKSTNIAKKITPNKVKNVKDIFKKADPVDFNDISQVNEAGIVNQVRNFISDDAKERLSKYEFEAADRIKDKDFIKDIIEFAKKDDMDISMDEPSITARVLNKATQEVDKWQGILKDYGKKIGEAKERLKTSDLKIDLKKRASMIRTIGESLTDLELTLKDGKIVPIETGKISRDSLDKDIKVLQRALDNIIEAKDSDKVFKAIDSLDEDIRWDADSPISEGAKKILKNTRKEYVKLRDTNLTAEEKQAWKEFSTMKDLEADLKTKDGKVQPNKLLLMLKRAASQYEGDTKLASDILERYGLERLDNLGQFYKTVMSATNHQADKSLLNSMFGKAAEDITNWIGMTNPKMGLAQKLAKISIDKLKKSKLEELENIVNAKTETGKAFRENISKIVKNDKKSKEIHKDLDKLDNHIKEFKKLDDKIENIPKKLNLLDKIKEIWNKILTKLKNIGIAIKKSLDCCKYDHYLSEDDYRYLRNFINDKDNYEKLKEDLALKRKLEVEKAGYEYQLKNKGKKTSSRRENGFIRIGGDLTDEQITKHLANITNEIKYLETNLNLSKIRDPELTGSPQDYRDVFFTGLNNIQTKEDLNTLFKTYNLSQADNIDINKLRGIDFSKKENQEAFLKAYNDKVYNQILSEYTAVDAQNIFSILEWKDMKAKNNDLFENYFADKWDKIYFNLKSDEFAINDLNKFISNFKFDKLANLKNLTEKEEEFLENILESKRAINEGDMDLIPFAKDTIEDDFKTFIDILNKQFTKLKPKEKKYFDIWKKSIEDFILDIDKTLNRLDLPVYDDFIFLHKLQDFMYQAPAFVKKELYPNMNLYHGAEGGPAQAQSKLKDLNLYRTKPTMYGYGLYTSPTIAKTSNYIGVSSNPTLEDVANATIVLNGEDLNLLPILSNKKLGYNNTDFIENSTILDKLYIDLNRIDEFKKLKINTEKGFLKVLNEIFEEIKLPEKNNIQTKITNTEKYNIKYFKENFDYLDNNGYFDKDYILSLEKELPEKYKPLFEDIFNDIKNDKITSFKSFFLSGYKAFELKKILLQKANKVLVQDTPSKPRTNEVLDKLDKYSMYDKLFEQKLQQKLLKEEGYDGIIGGYGTDGKTITDEHIIWNIDKIKDMDLMANVIKKDQQQKIIEFLDRYDWEWRNTRTEEAEIPYELEKILNARIDNEIKNIEDIIKDQKKLLNNEVLQTKDKKTSLNTEEYTKKLRIKAYELEEKLDLVKLDNKPARKIRDILKEDYKLSAGFTSSDTSEMIKEYFKYKHSLKNEFLVFNGFLEDFVIPIDKSQSVIGLTNEWKIWDKPFHELKEDILQSINNAKTDETSFKDLIKSTETSISNNVNLHKTRILDKAYLDDIDPKKVLNIFESYKDKISNAKTVSEIREIEIQILKDLFSQLYDDYTIKHITKGSELSKKENYIASMFSTSANRQNIVLKVLNDMINKMENNQDYNQMFKEFSKLEWESLELYNTNYVKVSEKIKQNKEKLIDKYKKKKEELIKEKEQINNDIIHTAKEYIKNKLDIWKKSN